MNTVYELCQYSEIASQLQITWPSSGDHAHPRLHARSAVCLPGGPIESQPGNETMSIAFPATHTVLLHTRMM